MRLRFSLRTRILLLVVGTMGALAVLLLAGMGLLARREIERQVRADVRATGGVLAEMIEERSRALEGQCRLLAQQPALTQFVFGRNLDDETTERPDWATITDYCQSVLPALRGADAVLVTDGDGRALGETGQKKDDGRRRGGAREPAIARALTGEANAVVVAHGANRLRLAVSVPICPPRTNYVRGTLTVYAGIDDRLARDLRRALGASRVVFVENGRVAGSSLEASSGLIGGTAFDAPKGRSPRLLTLGGRRWWALYAPLPRTAFGTNAGFVTLRSDDEASGTFRRLRVVFGASLVLALLVALGAGALVARDLVRPLDGVVRAARVLREGGWPDLLTGAQRSDEIGLLQGAFNEMTASLRTAQDRLLALIDTDPLTGLPNHRRFQERLAEETRRALPSEGDRRTGEALSLLLLDLDEFKAFNQRHGHAGGDDVLRQVAALLKSVLPDIAISARYGGEEFAVLLPRHDIAQAEQVAEALRACAHAGAVAGRAPGVTLSIGCAQFGTHTKQAEGLVLAAELAASRAKQLGRNRVCRFDSVPGADTAADPYQLHRFLHDGSLSTIQALAAAVDAKDPYTQGHSQRVADYARALAVEIGLPRADVDLVFTTGTLHDVGKIGVPDAILKKPGHLSDEERTVMETHPALGEVIVKKAPQLSATLPGVRSHHERWDGKGYPDGLSGENIPLLARVLAVADTFDAMTSDRPYRKGLSMAVALGEIEKNAGTQFDPHLAPVFVALMRSRIESRESANETAPALPLLARAA